MHVHSNAAYTLSLTKNTQKYFLGQEHDSKF